MTQYKIYVAGGYMHQHIEYTQCSYSVVLYTITTPDQKVCTNYTATVLSLGVYTKL
jgi:hypothetical protein